MYFCRSADRRSCFAFTTQRRVGDQYKPPRLHCRRRSRSGGRRLNRKVIPSRTDRIRYMNICFYVFFINILFCIIYFA